MFYVKACQSATFYKKSKEGIKISTVQDIVVVIEAKKQIEAELEAIRKKLKQTADNLDLDNLDDCSYEEVRDLFKEIRYYADKRIVERLSIIVEQKKIEKYPELLKPTYYPEIDTLAISASEKLRLDKAARNNIKNYMTGKDKELSYPLSVEDLELLKGIGIVEKKYKFECLDCGCSCAVISESDLEKYKRSWELVNFEKTSGLTLEQEEEADKLFDEGYYSIHLFCIHDEEFEAEIASEEEFNEYKNNIEVVYKIVKKPDLAYEKL